MPRRLLITLLELSLTMFLGAHWMGCVYFYIGFDPDGSTPHNDTPPHSPPDAGPARRPPSPVLKHSDQGGLFRRLRACRERLAQRVSVLAAR